MSKFDYLIIGSGLFGSIFAYEKNKIGKKCLVIEKSNHIGGNCYTENIDGINVHKYGAHIFHTNDEKIWNYINKFATFNNYRHTVIANFNNKIFSLPINLMTFYQIWGITNPKDVINKLEEVRLKIDNPSNLEDWILSQVGEEVYNTLIKEYTQKQWNTHPKNLPSSIIKRLPIRLDFDNNYFFDKYQGIPIGGYTQIFEKLLNNIEVRLNTNYFNDRGYYDSIAHNIVYTGKIDEYYDYKFGQLDYRSLRFEIEKINTENYQGCSVMNYNSLQVPYTRIIEHKHFESEKTKTTVITKEYSENYSLGKIPYYPINDDKNNKIYYKYKDISKNTPNVIFGGRLAEYKYYDMHQIVGSALSKIK